MSRSRILVSYSIERGPFSKSRWQTSLWTNNNSPQYDMAAIRERLRSLHDKNARIAISNIEAEKDIPNNPFTV